MRHAVLYLLAVTGAGYGQEFRWDERLQHYVHRTYSWQRLTLLAADSAFDHLVEEPKAWGRNPKSFTYRYSAGFGRRVVRNSIELGLGAVLDEDMRFRPSQAGGLKNRLRYALTHAFLAWRPDGTAGPAYARYAATAGGVLIGSRWHPEPLTASRFFQGAGWGMIGHMQNSLLTEFAPDMKRFGKRLAFGWRRQGLRGHTGR